MNSKTAAKVRRSLGMNKTGIREEIASSIAHRVADASKNMLRTGLEDAGPLSALAADIAYKRSVDAVLELAKHGPERFVRDITPLRWLGIGLGPKGKSLSEAVVQSRLTSKMVGALKVVSPDPLTRAALSSSRWIHDKFDSVARLLNNEWDARKLTGFHIMRRTMGDANAAMVNKNLSNIRRTEVSRWYAQVLEQTRPKGVTKVGPVTTKVAAEGLQKREEIFRRFAIAIDTGNLTTLKGQELKAALEFRRIMRETVAVDVRKGLMKADNVRRNYFPHYIDAPQKILNKLIAARPGRTAKTQATIGRTAELRTFQTIPEIEEVAKLLNVDPQINFDPMVALRNRTQQTIEASNFQDFYGAVAKELGKDNVPLSAQTLFKMGEPLLDQSSKAARVVERLVRGKKPDADTLARLGEKYGDDAVGEYLRQRIKSIAGLQGVARFMRKYERHMHKLPRLGAVEDLAPDGSRFVDVSSVFGDAFDGRLIPESAANSIKAMRVQTARMAEVDEFLAHYDHFTNGLKVYLTALFPAFHFRNKYGNLAQNFLDVGINALDPRKSWRAAQLYRFTYDGRNVLPRTPRKFLGPGADMAAWTNAGGRKVSFQEAASELRRNNIVRSHDEIFEETKRRIAGRPVKGDVAMEGLERTALLRRAKRKGTEVGGFIENQDRIALYAEHRARGLSEREATDRVNRMLFDYDSLTEFERTYLKRAIPFYVWTKKNIVLQARTLNANPGRQAAIAKTFAHDSQDPQALPLLEHEAGQLRMILDNNGKDVRMLAGIDLPIMAIDRLLPIGKLVRGDFSGATKSVFAQMNPILRVPAEIAANQSFWDGRPLDRQSSKTIGRLFDPDLLGPGKLMPKSVRQWMGWKKSENLQSGRTSYTFDGQKFYLMFRTWHVSRILSSSDGFFNRAMQDQGFLANSIASLTSLKLMRVNLDAKRRRVVDQRIEQIEQAMVEQGLVGRFSKTFELKDRPGRFKTTR